MLRTDEEWLYWQRRTTGAYRGVPRRIVHELNFDGSDYPPATTI